MRSFGLPRNNPVRPAFAGRTIAVLLLLILCGSSALMTVPAVAQDAQTPAAQRHAWYADHVEMVKTSMFKNLQWQFVGPTNISGRMTDVDVVTPRGQNYTIFVAGASGGVWRTKNEGTTWEPVFQHATSTSIGDVTITPSDPNIVWVGTGEANIFRSSMAGAGVYKSTDGGDTWEYKGLGDTHTIPRIVVHPTNPDIVYVAATGHEWTDNPDRGLYKTTDGGETWAKVLYINERTGVIDLVMHPGDPETLYAASWQRIRRKWNDPRIESGYEHSGIWKTTDGGANWMQINAGLPAPEHRGRIGIDIARSSPDIVYAFVDNYETSRPAPESDEDDAYGRPLGDVIKGATVFRTDDGGTTWARASEENEYMEGAAGTYGWVFGQLRVDPNDENTVYIMGLALNVSNDGGKTFRPLPGMHGDHHGLWIDPDNSKYLANVQDGGLAISYDGGLNWRNVTDNLPLAQFFNLNYDMATPFRVYGSMQDHGSFRGVVDLSNGRNAIPAVEFENAPGGEGSNHAIDPDDTDTVYSAGFYGTISRTNMATGEAKQIVPRPAEGEPRYRGQWLAPFIISPHNPQVIYHGMNKLFRSMDRGDTWETISSDLTYNDPDQLGDIPYQTLFSISESPFKFGLIYVGTDDGRVWVTRNSGEDWTETELALDAPRGEFVSAVVASAHDPATVFMALNGKRDDDFVAHLYKSPDYGATWESISSNIALGPINVMREDPHNPNVLYVGTDVGAYVSIDGGNFWHTLGGGLPSTFVQDLVIHPRDRILVAATHGRGMWAMDVSYFKGIDEEMLAKTAHLFAPGKATLPRGFAAFFGNAPKAAVAYYLNGDQDAHLYVKDAEGNVLKEIDATGDAGFNLVEWDLTRELREGEEPMQRFGFTLPTYVRPGEYTIVLEAGGAAEEAAIGVMQ